MRNVPNSEFQIFFLIFFLQKFEFNRFESDFLVFSIHHYHHHLSQESIFSKISFKKARFFPFKTTTNDLSDYGDDDDGKKKNPGKKERSFINSRM